MTTTTIAAIAAAARARRREIGLTQADLATRLGMSRRWLAEFEHGSGAASLESVLRLLAELGLDLELGRLRAGGTTPPADGIDLDEIIEEHRG